MWLHTCPRSRLCGRGQPVHRAIFHPPRMLYTLPTRGSADPPALSSLLRSCSGADTGADHPARDHKILCSMPPLRRYFRPLRRDPPTYRAGAFLPARARMPGAEYPSPPGTLHFSHRSERSWTAGLRCGHGASQWYLRSSSQFRSLRG